MTAFLDTITIAAQSFRLEVPRAFSRLAGGQVIPSRIGAHYWRGSIDIPPSYHRDALHELDLMALDQIGATFLAYDARFNGPRMDPGGTILGTASPEIHTLNADNRRMRVSGLPGGYVLMRGDYIGWLYGNSPVRYALHRLDEDVTASGAGLTPLFAVEPRIRQGASTGLPVVLVRPVCRALITASQYGNARPVITEGASFEWQETLR